MSFISLNQKDLNSLLSFCNQISPKRSDIEIFTELLVIAKNDNVEISAINSEVFYTTKLKPISLEDSSEEEIKFLINTDLFSSSIALVSDEIVGLDINTSNSTIIVQGAKSKHTLRINTDRVEEFTTPAQKTDKIQAKISVKTKDLLEANKAANVSVGNPRTVYQSEFLNVCYTLGLENKIAVVSTDRYRITRTIIDAKYTEINENIKEAPTNFLLNPKSLSLLDNYLQNEEEVEFSFEEDYLWINLAESSLVLRYGEGKYPDYNKIIPQSFACSFSVNTGEILEALKQVYFSARMNINNKSVKMEVTPKESKVKFIADTSDGYSSESSLSVINYQGTEEEWSQSFNAEYLLGYINNVKKDSILWESNPGKPSVLSPEGEKERQLYLVSGLK